MKKYINKLAVISLLVIFGLTACDQENNRGLYDTSLEPAYSMYQSVLVASLIPENNGVLKVTVTRTNADEDATVSIALTANAATLNLFSLESSTVKFAKGEYQASANILFTIANLSASASYSLEVAIQDSKVSIGGNAKTTVTAARRVTWRSIGTGTWLFSSTFQVAPEDNEPVGVQQAEEAPEMYRLVDFFSKPILMTINQSTNVATISLQATGVMSSGRELVMNCTGTYNPATKIVDFPRVNAANPQNYYYYLNGASYTAGWYLEETIKLP